MLLMQISPCITFNFPTVIVTNSNLFTQQSIRPSARTLLRYYLDPLVSSPHLGEVITLKMQFVDNVSNFGDLFLILGTHLYGRFHHPDSGDSFTYLYSKFIKQYVFARCISTQQYSLSYLINVQLIPSLTF